jgi:hypothetical protein
MNNSIVCLIGRKNVVVSRYEAEQVKKIIENDSIQGDYLISLKKISFRKGSVRSIEVEPDSPSNQSSQDMKMREFYDEEKKMVEKETSYSPEVKSKYMDFFNFLWYCSCSEKEVPREITEKAQKIQYDFFLKNPNKRFCDPNLFRPIMKMNSSLWNMYSSNGLKLADKTIYREMQLAGEISQFTKSLADKMSI